MPARLAFIGLWNFADDAGVHPASVKTLKAEVFPADDISVDVVGELVGELIAQRLLVEFEADGRRYWHVTGWTKHQKIDRPTFRHPAAPCSTSAGGAVVESSTDCQRAIAERSSNDRRGIVEDSASPHPRKGKEGKGEEQSSLRSDSQPPVEAVDLLPDTPPAATVHPHPGGKTAEVVLAAYHQLLPSCQRIVVLNPKRKRRVLAADKMARQLCQQLGWEYDATAFWQAYFERCTADPWLRGDMPNPHNPRWKQSLDVLLAEDRFAQIMDQAVTALGDAA